MFRTLTTSKNTSNSSNKTISNHISGTATHRRSAAKITAVFAGLALASSACGGSAPTAADVAAPGLAADSALATSIDAADDLTDSLIDGTDTAAADTGADTGSDAGPTGGDVDQPEPDTAGELDGNPTDSGNQSDGDPAPVDPAPVDPAPTDPTPNPPTPIPPVDPAPVEPAPAQAADLADLRISAPELAYAQACFADSPSLVWQATGTNGMLLDDYLGTVSESQTVRSPMSVTSQDNGGPLLVDGFSTTFDQDRGFLLSWEINGSLGGVDVRWASNTVVGGSFVSPVFVSDSNPACFVKVGFRATVEDVPEPPVTPDFQVAVRNVKIDAAPSCFAGQIATRVFDTDTVPVTVVLDTNGVSATQISNREHTGTELTAGLSELSISDGALQGYATDAAGYVVTVQMQGFLTGGIAMEWVTTVTEPGLQTSPVFSSSAGDCDVTMNFLVLETDI